MKKSELLVDYCQRCGAEMGSFDCCQSSTNKSYRQYGDLNPNHKSPFTYVGTIIKDDSEVMIDYKDRGWANGGVPHCDCDRSHKEEYDNGYYANRGKDTITICHSCKSFIHTDMGD